MTLAVGATLILVPAIAASIALTAPTIRWILVGGIALSLVGSVLVRRHRTDGFDLVDPVVIFAATWFAMFVVRPIGSGLTGDWTLRRRYDVETSIDSALALALVAALAFVIAYLIAARRSPKASEEPRVPMSAGTFMVAGLVAAIGILATIASLGSPIDVSSAYVQSLPALAIPGSLLLVAQAFGRSSIQRAGAYGLVAISVVSFGLIGVRTWILPLVGAVVLLWYLQRGTRPRVKTAVLLGLVALVAFGNIEVTRSLTGGAGRSIALPAGDLGAIAALERLVTGPSSEMLPALALEIGTEGTDWTMSPGYWATSLVTHWIPSALWPTKPRSSGELLYSMFFPDDYAISRANTQFSVIGELYFDSGVAGVILGLVLLGWVTAKVYVWFERHRQDPWAQVAYSMFPWLLVFALRGDLLQSAALGIFLYLPLVVARTVAELSAGARLRSTTGRSLGLPVRTRPS